MASTTQTTYKHAGAILFVIALSSFLATFNETILNVALNPLMSAFSIDYSAVQWTITLNMLVIAVVIPIAGFLMRRVQTRVLIIGSLAVTLAGSAMGAFATSFPMLLAARIVQAAGTGVTMPVTMALTLVIAPRNRLGTYMGIVSVLTTLGPSFGPIAAGFVLAGTDDWHLLFVLFGAFVLVCLVAAVIFVPDVAETDRAALDVPSVALVTVALVGIMYGITEAFRGGVGLGGACLVVGAAALVAFAWRQRRIPNPLIDLSPFAKGGFSIGILMMSLAFMSTFAMNIVIPLFLQGALGQTAFGAALVLLPATIFSALCSPIGGRIFDRFGVKALIPTAFILIMGGTFALGHIDAGVDTLVITLIFIPVVIGTAIGTSPSQSFALSRLDGPERNHGVTIVAVALQVAGCIGSSAFVGIMSASEGANLAAGMQQAAAQAAAFDTTCFVVCGIGAVGLLLSLYTGLRVGQGASGWLEPVEVPAPQVHRGVTLGGLMGDDRWSIPQQATAFEALSQMAAHKTGGLPILDAAGRVTGFITDGDIMRYLAGGDPDSIGNSQMFAWWRQNDRVREDLLALQEVPALSLAARRVVAAEVDEGVDSLIRKFSDVRVKRVPVCENGRFVGTIHRSDLLPHLLDIAAEEPDR